MDETTGPEGTSAGGMTCSDWAFVNETALWAHAQRDVGALQAGALDRLGTLIPHRASMFDLAYREEDGGVRYADAVSTTMDPEALERYYGTYAAQDYTVWSFNATRTEAYRDLDLVDVATRDRTAFFRGWMEPQGLYFGMGSTIACEGIAYGSITLFRSRVQGEFTDRELACLLEVTRHIGVRLHDLHPRGMDAAAGTDTARRLAQAHGLNPREEQALRLMLHGASNREIASGMLISESTAKKHVNAVYRKLGVANRMGLVRRACSALP